MGLESSAYKGSTYNRFRVQRSRQAGVEKGRAIPPKVRDRSAIETGLRATHQNASALLERERLDPLDYEQEISADRRKEHEDYVAELEAKFREERKTIGEMGGVMTEAAVFQGIAHGKWLGAESRVYVASKYDDYRNGIDLIVEFSTGGGKHTFFIDVKLGQKSVLAAAREIKRGIDIGELSEATYFQDEESDTVGLKEVPKVVVTLDEVTVGRLNRLALSNNLATMAHDVVRFRILEDICQQFALFAEYAEETKKPAIAQKHREIQQGIQRVLAQMKETSEERDDAAFDMHGLAASIMRRSGIFPIR